MERGTNNEKKGRCYVALEFTYRRIYRLRVSKLFEQTNDTEASRLLYHSSDCITKKTAANKGRKLIEIKKFY